MRTTTRCASGLGASLVRGEVSSRGSPNADESSAQLRSVFGVESGRALVETFNWRPAWGFAISPPLWPETRGVLPRVSGPLQEGAPQHGRWGASAHGRPQCPRREHLGEAARWERCHARASIPLTVLACQIPFCLVGMSFRLRLPAISRKDSPPARCCRMILIAACSASFFTSWWPR